ncbi:extracellular solute-binding protein [Paenibacillus ginsengarvi]|uniref:Extracellular solute-binding protein n=1 Tax=Paenibacillus ginsengarvi TaxID=400777 RepID=A0A3B0CA47_9BACL|nr:extracellular solute-binding protein [Paenibacillus ginsengarvi]RKN80637.1 extracellular solute-binding protein [Paenibacillus ginsengarvi]
MRGRPTNEQFRQLLEHMVQTLKTEIEEGQYEPGADLPSEKALALRFGLSNLSARKGLATLAEEGWIEKIPNVGNRVLRRRQRVVLTLGLNETTMRNLGLVRLLEDFGRLYPWIEVKVKTYASGGEPGRAEAKTDNPPDVYTMNSLQFRQLCELGKESLVEPLDAHPGVFPLLNEDYTFRGVCRLRPLIFAPVVLCYNKRHFREKGLTEPNGSWTWDDLTACAEQLTEGERYGFCFHLPDVNRWPIFLLQSLGDSGADAEAKTARLTEGAKLCKRIVGNRRVFPTYMSESNGDIEQMFLEGRLSMVLASYMAMNEWKDAGLEYDISPVPFLTEPRTLYISTGAGVARTTAHPEEARLLIDYLAGERAQALIREHTLSIPAMQRTGQPGWGRQTANPPDRYGLYREMMFSCRTHRHLPVQPTSMGKLAGLMKAFWANMISEEELGDRIGVLVREAELHGTHDRGSPNVQLE